MRKTQSSMTAIVRAIESEKPETERICFDPYVRQFVNGTLYYFTKRTVADGYAIVSAAVKSQ